MELPKYPVCFMWSIIVEYWISHTCSEHLRGFIFVFMFADIEAECQDDYMKIRIGFNGSFAGLLYSSGMSNEQTHFTENAYTNAITMIS